MKSLDTALGRNYKHAPFLDISELDPAPLPDISTPALPSPSIVQHTSLGGEPIQDLQSVLQDFMFDSTIKVLSLPDLLARLQLPDIPTRANGVITMAFHLKAFTTQGLPPGSSAHSS